LTLAGLIINSAGVTTESSYRPTRSQTNRHLRAADAPRPSVSDLWPLFGIRVRTRRLELRPPGDEEIAALATVARRGIHDPAVMPFPLGWTDRTGDDFDRGFAQYFWAQRACWSLDSWTLPFAVFLGGEPVGVQQLSAEAFPVMRTVGTSSWLARSVQASGVGTEMRAAVLDFAFTALGAEFATSTAYTFNTASIRVSEKLGYEENGVRREVVRGRSQDTLLFRISRDAWTRCEHAPARVQGFDAARTYFEAVFS
jgi:RimJ/RimL family protein N-acetyltransferase